MKDPSVKDNNLILIRYYSSSLLHFNLIVREESRGERGGRNSTQREPENRGASVSRGDFIFEREAMKYNQLITNGTVSVSWLLHITKMKHEADTNPSTALSYQFHGSRYAIP